MENVTLSVSVYTLRLLLFVVWLLILDLTSLVRINHTVCQLANP